MHDLVIRGGTVIDGSGAPAFQADVAVRNGVIVEVGTVEGPARRTVDATGLLVTPGFVDIHTHFDGQATWDPHLTPSCWHGVTTAIVGNCGVGFAPVQPDGHDELIEIMEGVEDIPGTALSEGIQWDWESFPEYLDALERTPRALDIATHVPHAPLRAFVMGDRSRDDADADDLAAMARLVSEAIAAGALGFATGRTSGHSDNRGRSVPGTFAPEDELSILMEAMIAGGGGVFQLVPAGVGGQTGGDPLGAMEREVEQIIRLGTSSGQPVTFLIMEQAGATAEDWHPWFEAVQAANDAGADIHPQVASRCFGVLMGHQSRVNPFKYRPSYAAIAHLPLSERVVELRKPEVRAQILAEEPVYTGRSTMDHIGRRAFDNLFPLGGDLDYEPKPEDSIRARARALDVDPWEVAYDTMLDYDGKEFLLLPLLNYGGGSYDGLYEMMVSPGTVQGLGDGGAHVGLVCDASMTTYLLTHWTRDRVRGPKISVEAAVKRLTSDPASLYGLGDRGVIAVGAKADINLIDYDELRLVHPEQVHDLPAGAGRLIQRSEGYVATYVSGEEVVVNGELTDARPGVVVRGRRGLSPPRATAAAMSGRTPA
jgi:N-acyl-D-amino-acid deacylase